MTGPLQGLSLTAPPATSRQPFEVRHECSARQLVEILVGNGDSRRSLKLLACGEGKSVLLKDSQFHVRKDDKGDPLVFVDRIPNFDPSNGTGVFLVTDSLEDTAKLADAMLQTIPILPETGGFPDSPENIVYRSAWGFRYGTGWVSYFFKLALLGFAILGAVLKIVFYKGW